MSKSEEGNNIEITPIFYFFVLTFAIFWGGTFTIYFLPDLYYIQNLENFIGVLATLLVGIPSFAPTISAVVATRYF